MFYLDQKSEFYLKKIHSVKLKDEESLIIKFTDRTGIKITDDARYCCETRFLSCDDNIHDLKGGNLLYIEEKKVEENKDKNFYYYHDIMFIEIMTTKGGITLCSYNDHNGYYGGFEIKIERI